MKPDPRVAAVIEIMQRRMRERVTIPEFARSVNLSPSRFTHLFKQQTGSSPRQYLRDFRLDRARLLLETTTLSIREVMDAVGLSDPSHFSRDFHAVYGVCPREWRKRLAPRAGGAHDAPEHTGRTHPGREGDAS